MVLVVLVLVLVLLVVLVTGVKQSQLLVLRLGLEFDNSDYLEGKLDITDYKCLVVNGGYSTNNIRHLVDQDYK